MPSNALPKISVVIITYNRVDLLPKAIASVMAQSFRDFEIIIIDDSSQDGTEAYARGLAMKEKRVKYFRNEFNLGISKSRNRGVAFARGEYIAMLDSDDYWLDKNKLKKQSAYLDKYPDVGLIGTAIRCENEKGVALKEDVYAVRNKAIRERLLLKNQFAQSSVMYRKQAYVAAGGYDNSLSLCEDYDLWLKIGKDWKLANLSKVMTAYLVHSGGITKERKLKTIAATDLIVRRYRKDYPRYVKARLKSGLRVVKALV